jgi:hypothetical protein
MGRVTTVLCVPKQTLIPLPTWLTHFEDYEEELLTEFCPPSENSSPSTSTFHTMVNLGSGSWASQAE